MTHPIAAYRCPDHGIVQSSVICPGPPACPIHVGYGQVCQLMLEPVHVVVLNPTEEDAA